MPSDKDINFLQQLTQSLGEHSPNFVSVDGIDVTNPEVFYSSLDRMMESLAPKGVLLPTKRALTTELKAFVKSIVEKYPDPFVC